jgi:hypothetical protein
MSVIPEGTELAELAAPVVAGDQVVAYSRGRFRVVEVESVGPKNTRIRYRTDSGHETRKAVPHRELYVRAGDPRAGELAGTVRSKNTRETDSRYHSGKVGHALYAPEVS